MKLAVLSNINMDPLKAHLKKMDVVDPYFCSYGQHLLELLDPQSILHRRDFDAVFVHLDGEELLKGGFFQLPQAGEVDACLEDLMRALQSFCDERPQVSVIISSIVLPPFSFASHLEANSRDTLSACEDSMNRCLRQLSDDRSNVFFLDFERLLRLHGYKTFCDDKYWYLGRIRYTEIGFKALAQDLNSLLLAIRGGAKKVLVLDLDNTLWGGVLGEDGPNGVKLSEDGIGKSYRDFQKCIKALKSIGIILALNSKNNESNVEEFFQQSPMLVLKYGDFVARRVNWKNKVDNLREIADELNVGTNSLVFIDDSPIERALVGQYLSDVAVPDFPQDPALLKSWFLGEVVYRYFPRVRLTKDDLQKSEQYERNLQRRDLSSRLNLKDFIAGLEIKLTLIKDDSRVVTRIAQLTQKTNQFNFTTRRYTDAEIHGFVKSDQWVVYGLEYEDRFGPEGLIGVCIVECRGVSAAIVNFLLSCRVLGRNVECRFLSDVLEDLKSAGVTRISSEYIPSSKNAIAGDFYANSGLLQKESGGCETDVSSLLDTLYNNVAVNSDAQHVG